MTTRSWPGCCGPARPGRADRPGTCGTGADRAGRTNAEIAAALFVGEGTVKTHINHVFAKLGLRDRAAAVVFAFDHDLVPPHKDRG
jgi:hypothetical protein